MQHSIIQKIIAGGGVIRKYFINSFAKEEKGGVPFSQWLVINLIHDTGAVTAKTIHLKLGISSSAAAQLVLSLQKKKLVIKKTNPDDRREGLVMLSKTGSALVKKMEKKHAAVTARMFCDFTESELEQYLALQEKIITSISVPHTH